MYREAPRAQVREVYVSEQFYSRYGEELGLSAWGRQMEILSDHVFSHVSDTKTPQGILLVMEQRSCEICEMLDLCVIPCVACSSSGVRLGYGGGYYDRFLPETRAKRIILCQEQMLCENIPAEPHDCPMDLIVTEERVREPV